MVVFLTFFIVLSVALAGCTSQAPSVTPAPSASQAPEKILSTIEPAQMALQPSDIPGNFTLVEKGERNASEMLPWQINQGWKKGYYVVLQRNDTGPGPERFIEQYISMYPAENSSLIVNYQVGGIMYDFSDQKENVIVTELTSPGIGDSCRAIRIINKNDPDIWYLIAFAKYDVFEEFWGRNVTATDYETLRQAATIAEAKIT